MNKTLKLLTTVSLAAGGYVLAKGLVGGVMALATPTPAEIVDRALATEPTRSSYQAMLNYFPDVARAQRALLLQRIEAGEMSQPAMAALTETLRANRQPLAQMLAGADDAAIIALLDDQIDLYRRFADDPATCGRIVALGHPALPIGDARLATYDLAAAADRLYRTMSEARHVAPLHEPATDAHYGPLAALLHEAGLTDADYDAMEANDPANPRLCGATLTFFETVRNGDFVGAERVRSEMMIDLASM